MEQRPTPDDHLFLVMERLMGASTTPQFVWRVPVDPDDPAAVDDVLDRLRRIADRIANGRLSRRVHRVPGPARDRWHFSPDAGRIVITDRKIPCGQESDWVAARQQEPLDSVDGPSWNFSAAPTDDAEVLVSLVWTHVVSDGASAIRAVIEAVNPDDDHVEGTPSPVIRDVVGPRRPVQDRVRDQLVDTATLLGQAARAVFHLVRGSVRGGSAEAGTGATTGTSESSESVGSTDGTDGAAGAAGAAGTGSSGNPDRTVEVPSVSFELDAATFAEKARGAGGTPNSLFQALTVGVLVASGRISDGDTVPVSVPIARRESPELTGDLRANATTGATLKVTVSPDIHSDLGPLRSAAKTAYSVITDEESAGPSATVSLTELAQALPDAVVKKLSSDATLPLCLASNLGDPGEELATLGFGTEPVPGRQVTVVPRMTVQAGSRDQLIARRGGLSAWALQNGATLVLSFTSLDPSHVPDTSRLRDLVSAELDRWDLSATAVL